MASVSEAGADPRRVSNETYVRQIAAIGCAGAVSGLLVGGVGGRLAMRYLAATNEEDSGAITDDGFVVGDITLGGTIQLLATTTQVALVGAALFILIRPLLLGPAWFRVVSVATGTGVVFGAIVAHPGVDFEALDPPLLAISLFVALPFAAAGVFCLLAYRWLDDDSWFAHRPFRWVTATLAVWLLSGIGLILVVPLMLIGIAVHRAARDPEDTTVSYERRRWLGRAALMIVVVGAAFVNLANDVTTLA
ncbi:MAG TPA: hypothetical protein VEX15_24310 [Nocardioidaceae bacterium]|nr:hypothetical protein [Nocardioidaceae bacterium]